MEKKLLLLGILRQQEMHGYQLNEFIDANLSLCTDLKKPTAYFLLDKMAAEGWITAEQEQEGNRPPRRVYRLTPAGEQAYEQLLRENLSEYQSAVFPGDMGLAFLDSMKPEDALALLQKQRDELAARLTQFENIPDHGGSLNLIFEHQIHHLKAELAWLDGVMARLETQ